MTGKINSHIYLMLSVYVKTVEYGCQRHRILQNFTGFEI